MKRVLAVIVSIVWLGIIVGVPALVLTGNAMQFVPTTIQDQIAQLGGQDVLTRLGLDSATTTAIDEPMVVMGTSTPPPEIEATAVSTQSSEPTPTDAPRPVPTTTPQVEPTAEPVAEPTSVAPAVESVAFPVSVKGQADLRTGPGLESDSVGFVDAGATVLVSAQDETGEWFQLDNGNWIAGEVLTSKPPVPVIIPGQEVTPAAPAIETPNAAANATPVAPATPVVLSVNADANLRSGPGGTFDRVGGASFGSDVTVVGKFATDNWYLLDDGSWIFGELLDSVPSVPEVNADGTPVGGGTPLATTIAPSATVSETVQATTPITTTPTSNSLANLRAAPNTTAEITGSAQPGQALLIVAKNAAGDWLKLADGSWIFAELVDNAPSALPIATDEASVEPSPVVATSAITTTLTATSELTTTSEITTTGTTTTDATTASPAGGSTSSVDANLRSGPGTTFDLVGSITAGTGLILVGQNEAGDWYQLENGTWIFGELVNDPPADLPITPSES